MTHSFKKRTSLIFILILLLFGCVLLYTSCSCDIESISSSSSSLKIVSSIAAFSSSTSNDYSSSDGNASSSSAIAVGMAIVRGRINLPSGSDLKLKAGAEVYVLGQENLKVTSDNLGNYNLKVDLKLKLKLKLKSPLLRKYYETIRLNAFEMVPTNGYQILIRSSDQTLGTKIDNIQLSEFQDYDQGDVPVHLTGNISGRVTLQAAGDYTGADIYIPGTSFGAKTGADGSYTIIGVPEGLYDDIRAEKDGYSFGVLPAVRVASGSNTQVADMVLMVSLGADGAVVIDNDSPFTTTMNVKLLIMATSNAVLMKLSERSDFLNAKNQLISTSVDFAFSGPGWRTNFLMLYDANGLSSGPYYDAIFIDTNPTVGLNMPGGVISALSPAFNWTEGTLKNYDYHRVFYRLQISTSSNFNPVFIDITNLIDYNYISSGLSLSNDVSYYWRVAIVETNGIQWGWSPFRKFIPDVSPPVIANINLSDGSLVSKDFFLSGIVSDNQGVQSVYVKLDDNPFQLALLNRLNALVI